MKKVVLIFFIIVSSKVSSQQTFNPAEFPLIGNIKSVQEVKYKDSLKKTPLGYISKFTFDKSGKKIEEEIIFTNNKPPNIYKYLYDSNGNDSVTFFKSKRNIPFRLFKEFKRYKNKNLIYELSYDANDSISEKIIYTINDKNQIISKKQFKNKDTLFIELKYTYDKYGNTMRWEWLNKERVVCPMIEKIYKRKLQKEKNSYYKGKLLSNVKYKYNRHQKVKKIISKNYRKKTTTKSYYEYNDKQLIIKEIFIKQNKYSSHYTYNYDNHDNWIEIKYFKKNIKTPEYIKVREIEYY